MECLPDGKILLTEIPGSLKLLDRKGLFLGEVRGVPKVEFDGQVGMGDIALHPAFEQNNLIYLSYAEAGQNNTFGAAVVRAKLNLSQSQYFLTEPMVTSCQYPKVPGRHFGHRLVFGSEGYLLISS